MTEQQNRTPSPMMTGPGWSAPAAPGPARTPSWRDRRAVAKKARMELAAASADAKAAERAAKAAAEAAARQARVDAKAAARAAKVAEAKARQAAATAAIVAATQVKEPVAEGPGTPDPVRSAAPEAAPAPSVEVPEQSSPADTVAAQPAPKLPSRSAVGFRTALDRQVLTPDRVRKLVGLGVVITLLGALSGFVGALVWPATYAARAQVLFPITIEQPTGFLREDRNLTTQLVVLGSRAVLGPVATAEGRSVEDVDKDVSAELVDGSELIEVEVRDGSSADALKTLEQVIAAYLKIDQAQRSTTSREYLQGELARVRQQLDDERFLFQSVLRSPTGVGSLTTASEASGRLEANPAPRPQVLTPPYEVDDQVSPKPLMTTATGALAGILIAAAVVALTARRWARG